MTHTKNVAYTKLCVALGFIELTNFSTTSIHVNVMATFLQSFLHIIASKEGKSNEGHNGGNSTNNTTNPKLNNYCIY